MRQETTIIEAADEVFHRLDLRRGQIGELRLLHQVFLQRRFADERIEKMLTPLGIFRGVRLRASDARHVVTPVFVQFSQDFEFLVLGKIHLVPFRIRLVLVGWRRAGRRIASTVTTSFGLTVAAIFLR